MQKRPCEEALILARVRRITLYAGPKYTFSIHRGGDAPQRAELGIAATTNGEMEKTIRSCS
jgi:hypothetical protein